jgi:hypothetical protein
MKQILLFAFLLLSIKALAQPTITFTPLNGTSGVSISNNLTISFSAPVRNIDDSNISSSNVDALIQLRLNDEFGSSVGFDATINGDDDVITIEPSSNLDEGQVYYLSIASVENNSNQATAPVSFITFTTGDFTDPTITSANTTINTGTTLTFNITADDDGTVFYVVTNSGTTPSYAEIEAGENESGTPLPATQTGSLVISSGIPVSDLVTGLAAGTKYRVHFFVRDDGGNDSAIETRSEPIRNSSSTSLPTGTGFRLSAEYDMDGNTGSAGIKYVVTTSATVPTHAQILAGQNDAGAAALASGSFQFSANNNVNEIISDADLAGGGLFHVHFFAVNNSGSHSEISTENEITIDEANPSMTSLSPADGFLEVDISANTFTITFNENVDNISSGASDNTDRIRLFENGVQVESIDRNDATLDANGSILADGTSATATITFVHTLIPNEDYYILIGEDVFEDNVGNDFDGFLSTTDWNFRTSGVTLNNPSTGICTGSFQSIGNIIISENGVGDFNTGAGVTLEIELENSSNYILSTIGVTVAEAGNDISSISITSVTPSKVLITYTVAGATTKDIITIAGLRVYAAPSSPPTTLRRSGGNANQDGNNGTGASSLTYAQLSVGSSPPAAPTLAPAQDLQHCEGDVITGLNLSLNPQSGITFNWYSDASFSTLQTSTASTNVNIVSDLGLASPAVVGNYTFYVLAVGSCQSASALLVNIQVTPRPGADAGTFLTPICPGSSITIGGSPTLSAPSVSSTLPYTYAWTEPSGHIASFSSSSPNPIIPGSSFANPTSSNRVYDFSVTITDPLGCPSLPTVTSVSVLPVNDPVTISSPTQFNFADNGPAVDLIGSPAGGVFSGVGVVAQGSGTYKFDPVLATTTGSPHTITYTVTLTNSCSKTIQQSFTVSNGSGILLGLSTNLKYCNDEAASGTLALQPLYANILANFNYSLVGFGVTPIGFSTPPDVSLAIQGSIGTPKLIAPNPIPQAGSPPSQQFFPSQVPPGQYYIFAIIHSDGDPEGVNNFNWVGETVVVNPRPTVTVPAVLAAYCEENSLFNLTGIITGIQGNPVGGVFDISNDGGANFNANADGLVNTGAGTATFNPFDALNGSSTSKNFLVRYTFSPIGVGSNSLSCSSEVIRPVTVNPLPVVTFTGLPASNELCYNAAKVNLTTNLSSSPGISSIVYFGNGVFDNSDKTGYFFPKEGYDATIGSPGVAKTVTVSATAKSTVGCSRTINTVFEVNPPSGASFAFAKSELCYDPILQNPIDLTSQQNRSSFKITYVGSNPSFTETIPDDNPTTPLVVNFNPQSRFDDAVANHGLNSISDIQFLIEYTSQDNLGCEAYFQKVFTVSPKLNLSIAGVSNGEEYCANEESRTLVLSPSFGSFFVNNVSQATQPDVGGDRFLFGDPNGGAFVLKYQKLSGIANCLNEVVKNVTLLPSPQANFSNPSQCVGVPFTLASLNNANANNYRWDMDEGGSSFTTASVDYTYLSSSQLFASRDYNVELYIESAPNGISNTVCKDSITKVIRVGNIPKVNFSFSNVCENDVTSLNAASDIALQALQWNFGDGESTAFGNNNTNINEPSAPNTTGTYISPNHLFSSANNFDVTVTGRTDLGCQDTFQKEVKLLRKFILDPLNPYDGMANGQNGFWKPEDVNGNATWEFAPLNGTKISDPISAWTTNASGPYLPFDDSYMNSPCFNLSGFTRPVLSVEYWTDTENSDGATLEYSTDGGASWSLLGGLGTGLNWYDQEVISADPGIKGGIARGWSSNDQNSFLEGRHTLDEIPLTQRNSVRFRIAFAGFNNATNKDGFAFTNVKIQERNRTLLVENFTNNSDIARTEENTDDNNAEFREFKAGSSAKELVKIQYHTSISGFDENNDMNPIDNSARAAFYGVTQAAKGFIDGYSEGRFDGADWTDNEFSLRSLVSSPVDLDITSPDLSNNQFNIQVVVKANSAIPAGQQFVVQIALVEKSVGEEAFVMRKLLPSASGTPLTITTAGEEQTVLASYDLRNVLNQSQLAVVAFVQSIRSNPTTGRKEVLQSGFLDTGNLTIPTTIITEVEQLDVAFEVYPNPANEALTIRLPQAVNKASTLLVYDQMGKVVAETQVEKGEQRKQLPTKNLADGVYVLKIETAQGMLIRKVMVIH